MRRLTNNNDIFVLTSVHRRKFGTTTTACNAALVNACSSSIFIEPHRLLCWDVYNIVRSFTVQITSGRRTSCIVFRQTLKKCLSACVHAIEQQSSWWSGASRRLGVRQSILRAFWRYIWTSNEHAGGYFGKLLAEAFVLLHTTGRRSFSAESTANNRMEDCRCKLIYRIERVRFNLPAEWVVKKAIDF